MIHSMTGYARTQGISGGSQWVWDIKTVNAKGLDLRLRLPPGFDALEIEARRRIGTRLTRGTCHATLSLSRETSTSRVRIDTGLLRHLVESLATVSLPPAIGPATLDGLLAIRGVVESDDSGLDETEAAALRAACDTGLTDALDALVAMRAAEGRALRIVLDHRLGTIGTLTGQADAAPERQPSAVRERLKRLLATLGERHRPRSGSPAPGGGSDRRESRCPRGARSPRGPCRRGAGPHRNRRTDRAGKLDFLAQELGREASTYCAKVNDASLTAIGLELRVEIEQFREQVQNIE